MYQKAFAKGGGLLFFFIASSLVFNSRFARSPPFLPYFSHISPMQDGRNMGELTLK